MNRETTDQGSWGQNVKKNTIVESCRSSNFFKLSMSRALFFFKFHLEYVFDPLTRFKFSKLAIFGHFLGGLNIQPFCS